MLSDSLAEQWENHLLENKVILEIISDPSNQPDHYLWLGYLSVDSAVTQVGQQTQRKYKDTADDYHNGEVAPYLAKVKFLTQ